jgi:hypothetical protein
MNSAMRSSPASSRLRRRRRYRKRRRLTLEKALYVVAFLIGAIFGSNPDAIKMVASALNFLVK